MCGVCGVVFCARLEPYFTDEVRFDLAGDSLLSSNIRARTYNPVYSTLEFMHTIKAYMHTYIHTYIHTMDSYISTSSYATTLLVVPSS